MKKWRIKFKIPEGIDCYDMLYPFEPDEEAIIAELIENIGEHGDSEIKILNIEQIY